MSWNVGLKQAQNIGYTQKPTSLLYQITQKNNKNRKGNRYTLTNPINSRITQHSRKHTVCTEQRNGIEQLTDTDEKLQEKKSN